MSQAYERAQAFLQAADLPHLVANLVLYQETPPLFEAFGVEKESNAPCNAKSG